MRPPDAPRPPAGTGGRATDRAGSRIGAHHSRTGHTGEGYRRGTTLAVLDRLDRGEHRCPCEVCSPPRTADWVLRPDLRPATFEELVAAGILTNEDLAIPVEVVA